MGVPSMVGAMCLWSRPRRMQGQWRKRGQYQACWVAGPVSSRLARDCGIVSSLTSLPHGREVTLPLLEPSKGCDSFASSQHLAQHAAGTEQTFSGRLNL